jgi:hypothetical protein
MAFPDSPAILKTINLPNDIFGNAANIVWASVDPSGQFLYYGDRQSSGSSPGNRAGINRIPMLFIDDAGSIANIDSSQISQIYPSTTIRGIYISSNKAYGIENTGSVFSCNLDGGSPNIVGNVAIAASDGWETVRSNNNGKTLLCCSSSAKNPIVEIDAITGKITRPITLPWYIPTFSIATDNPNVLLMGFTISNNPGSARYDHVAVDLSKGSIKFLAGGQFGSATTVINASSAIDSFFVAPRLTTGSTIRQYWVNGAALYKQEGNAITQVATLPLVVLPFDWYNDNQNLVMGFGNKIFLLA